MKWAGLSFCLIAWLAAGACQAQDWMPSVLPCSESIVECERSGCANPRLWGGADYILWWFRRGPTPPLVVTGSPDDQFPGALDQPGTKVLFGDNGLRYHSVNGLRLHLGSWLDNTNIF